MISGTAPTRAGEANAADADVPCILAVDDTLANLVALERVMAGIANIFVCISKFSNTFYNV
jgi:hypothetical protein